MDRPSRYLNKKKVYRDIFTSLVLDGRPIMILFEDLRFPFGFQRMSGEAIMLSRLISNKSELEMQIRPNLEIEREISKWCLEKGITYFLKYEYEKYYLFTHMKIETTDSDKLHELLK